MSDPTEWEAVELERATSADDVWAVVWRPRSWRERLLSWPWRPWRAVDAVVLR